MSCRPLCKFFSFGLFYDLVPFSFHCVDCWSLLSLRVHPINLYKTLDTKKNPLAVNNKYL